jgi:glycosyltransferase involved in cell wall biosynthesis
MSDGTMPRCSVILPCLNEEGNLAQVLDALLGQDLPNNEFEIIVVDGGSSDRSVALAQERGVRVVNSERGVSRQRNLGAREASSSCLAFLDSDCIVGPDWLRRGLELLEAKGAVLAGGPIRSNQCPGWVGRAWDVHNNVRWRRLANQTDQFFRLITTANMFVRRNVFEEIDGFDEQLGSGEDYFFCCEIQRCGGRIVFDGKLSVQHLGQPSTLRAFFSEQVWHSNTEVWRRLRSEGHENVGQAAYRFGLLNILLLVGVLVGLTASLMMMSPWPVAVALVLYLGLPLALSLRTCLCSNCLDRILPLAVVYATYGLARAVYLLGIVRLGYRRK